MPFKNTSNYLVDCVQSIVNQIFIDWELIAVNDHSSDGSLQILREFENVDDRIKVLQNEGNGIIDALKTGYKLSEGCFITRMDSDDIMTENKLLEMYEQLESQKNGYVAIGLVKYFSETTLGNGYERYENWLNSLTKQGNNFEEIYKECVIPSPCWMMRREDFDKIGGFNSKIYPEDYDLCFRMYKAGFKVLPSNKILHHWRDYGNRTSRTSAHYSDNRFLELKIKYFLEIDFDANKKLLLWGAGKKGKWLANYLINNKIAFDWVSNNPKKVGVDIYGKLLIHQNSTVFGFDNQVVIAVSNEDEQAEISQLTQNSNAFWFC
jgi:glycosyltransferase involved in cell wall biosynthesis